MTTRPSAKSQLINNLGALIWPKQISYPFLSFTNCSQLPRLTLPAPLFNNKIVNSYASTELAGLSSGSSKYMEHVL